MTRPPGPAGERATASGAPPGPGFRRHGWRPRNLSAETVVAVVYVAGMFVNTMDSTVVNTALPAIARQFHTSTTSADWVVIGYLLSLAVWIPVSGWAGDRHGTKRTFLFALVLFTGASMLCGLAQTLPELVALRILQGVGGGMLAPVGQAMLFRAFPPERRASASAILIIPTVLAPASGPVIGGLLVTTLSWRWIFYVNVPIGIGAFLFGLLLLHEHREPSAGRFDVAGFLLSGLGFSLTLYAVSEGPTAGWTSPLILVAAGVGLASMAGFAVAELRRRGPMLDLRILSDHLFLVTNLVSAFGRAAFMGLLFAMPLFLQDAQHASALSSGLTTFPEAVGVLVSTQVVGRLYHSVGPRRLIVFGMLAMAIEVAGCGLIGLTTSEWLIRVLMFVIGVSVAYMILPLQTAAFARVGTADMGHATAIFNVQRQAFGAFGVAIIATVISAGAGAAARTLPSAQALAVGFHLSFVAAAVMALAAAAIALWIRDRDAAATMRATAPGPGQPEAAGG